MSSGKQMRVKRRHGLGDIVLLLPVLDKAASSGTAVSIETRPEWADVFAALRPRFEWSDEKLPGAVDLDALTAGIRPGEHRSDEFGRLLSVKGPFEAPSVQVPEDWKRPFLRLSGSVVFAPEAEHEARRAPAWWAVEIAEALRRDGLAVVGRKSEPSLPCDRDYRGKTDLRGLFGILASARAVVCMDSGILHLAAAVGVPTVAVFGGVEPRFRIRPDQNVVAIQADVPCCPCNKAETCDGRYDCLTAANADDIRDALAAVSEGGGLRVRRVPPRERLEP